MKYRIWTKDGRVKYAGTGQDSWFTLERARQLCDYDSGEMIYEHVIGGDKLWQTF